TGETRLRFWALAGQPPAVVPTNRKQAVPRSRNRGTNYPRSALAFDISNVIAPGTALATLIEGIFNLVPAPTLLSMIAWAVYLVVAMYLFLRPAPAPKPAKQQQQADTQSMAH
ncbi:hypothetical protein ACL1NM_12025, partial [Corynebacterium striatum]